MKLLVYELSIESYRLSHFEDIVFNNLLFNNYFKLKPYYLMHWSENVYL